MRRDGVTDPWRAVEVTAVRSKWVSGRRILRFGLRLSCGHVVDRPIPISPGNDWQEVAAPRKVRCQACTADRAERLLNYAAPQ